MPVKRTSHAVYDTTYHLVWASAYRRWIVREDIRARLEQAFREIAEDYGFELIGSGDGARAFLAELSSRIFDCQRGWNRREHFSQSGVFEIARVE